MAVAPIFVANDAAVTEVMKGTIEVPIAAVAADAGVTVQPPGDGTLPAKVTVKKVLAGAGTATAVTCTVKPVPVQVLHVVAFPVPVLHVEEATGVAVTAVTAPAETVVMVPPVPLQALIVNAFPSSPET
jgi:hypothetical protein